MHALPQARKPSRGLRCDPPSHIRNWQEAPRQNLEQAKLLGITSPNQPYSNLRQDQRAYPVPTKSAYLELVDFRSEIRKGTFATHLSLALLVAG